MVRSPALLVLLLLSGPVAGGGAGAAEVSSFSSLGKEINNFFIGVLDSGFLPNVLKVTPATVQLQHVM